MLFVEMPGRRDSVIPVAQHRRSVRVTFHCNIVRSLQAADSEPLPGNLVDNNIGKLLHLLHLWKCEHILTNLFNIHNYNRFSNAIRSPLS